MPHLSLLMHKKHVCQKQQQRQQQQQGLFRAGSLLVLASGLSHQAQHKPRHKTSKLLQRQLPLKPLPQQLLL
jgi:hypothetical protein